MEIEKISLNQIILICFALFLLGGFIIGFAVGGYSVTNNWKEYVADNCIQDQLTFEYPFLAASQTQSDSEKS